MASGNNRNDSSGVAACMQQHPDKGQKDDDPDVKNPLDSKIAPHGLPVPLSPTNEYTSFAGPEPSSGHSGAGASTVSATRPHTWDHGSSTWECSQREGPTASAGKGSFSPEGDRRSPHKTASSTHDAAGYSSDENESSGDRPERLVRCGTGSSSHQGGPSSHQGGSSSYGTRVSSHQGGYGYPSREAASSTHWGGSSAQEFSHWRPRRSEDCAGVLPHLSFGPDHTVLINVDEFNHRRKLVSLSGRALWDAHHVKMPYSNENIFMHTNWMGSTERKARWTVISKQLEKLHKGSPTVADVKNAIQRYNPQYEDTWSFVGLERYVQSERENMFARVIPKMAKLALRLPEIVPKAIPLLTPGRTHAITLSQYQIACLLANAFFCTFPHRNSTAKNAEYANYPTINFSSLFGITSHTVKEKLRAILHYFNTVTEEATKPSGLVTFKRCHFRDSELPTWRDQKMELGNVRVTSEGSIEREGKGMLQVDFACSMVGGGVLGHGLVQEEILFLMNPELIVSRLFTAKLSDNECLKITGAQQYSEYVGYSNGFEWSGPHSEKLPRDKWERLHRNIVAIDALNFKNPREQYHKNKIKRELNKAFIGFSDRSTPPDKLPAIATGNWGCGAFHGDPMLKALIQMMAAAVAQRDMVFYTFGDRRLEQMVWDIYRPLKERGVKVGDIYTLLDAYCQKIRGGNAMDLRAFLKSML